VAMTNHVQQRSREEIPVDQNARCGAPGAPGPHRHGGNPTTSAPPFSYGKAGYTIEQLGIANPLARPAPRDWDGLKHLLAALRSAGA
jgi:hypothetical protein